MSVSVGAIQAIAQALRQAESSYRGGDLSAHLSLARQHAALVARWISALGRAAGSSTAASPLDEGRLKSAPEFVTPARARAASAPVLIRDGAGVVLFPANRALLSLEYPLFTDAGLARYGRGLPFRPVNPLAALRWTLTDLLLRLNASNTPVNLNVADYHGDAVLVPYAHGFAIGSGALYSRAYTYAQPVVNVGFDDVALKVLSANLSAASGLSYAADVSAMASFAPSLTPLRRLLAANGISAAEWQALYQSSRVLDAVLALISRSHRAFGPDANPTHVGANIDRNAYGYGIMKAISQRDSTALARALADFTLPAVAAVPALTVPTP
jgi:hypothetical protein